MSLSKLIMTKKQKVSADVVYDKDWNVSLNLNYLPKHELSALLGRFTKQGKKTEPEIDTERLSEEMLKSYVNGWKGVTYEWLSNHIPLDTTEITDMKAEVPFSFENLKIVSENVYEFDGWLFGSVKDASNFRAVKKEEEVKN